MFEEKKKRIYHFDAVNIMPLEKTLVGIRAKALELLDILPNEDEEYSLLPFEMTLDIGERKQYRLTALPGVRGPFVTFRSAQRADILATYNVVEDKITLPFRLQEVDIRFTVIGPAIAGKEDKFVILDL